jgi:DNA-binding protein HU-beta
MLDDKQKKEEHRMTNQQLVDAIVQKTGLSRRDTLSVMKTFTDMTMQEVQKGGKVGLTGFGVFYLGKRGQRTGRNPQTGQLITIPSMKMPGFRAGKVFKERVRS